MGEDDEERYNGKEENFKRSRSCGKELNGKWRSIWMGLVAA